VLPGVGGEVLGAAEDADHEVFRGELDVVSQHDWFIAVGKVLGASTYVDVQQS
jgi:hypothetical protein